jgi:4-hydroxy-tetrahydrodipicolinate reductase
VTARTTGDLRIAILGVSGRMGRALVTAIDEIPGAVLSGGSASAGSRWLGQDASAAVGGPSRGVAISADPAVAMRNAAVAIDFTLPAATATNVAACVAARCPIVIGTTGHEDSVREQITRAAAQIPIVVAPNMSLGVNLLLKLVELAAQKLDSGYDIEIFEAHHRNKKDAPSGTALALGAAAASGRGVALEEMAEYDRHGTTGARRPGTIGFSVFRGGDVVGDHTVTFAGIGERIELTHRASDRMAFARGAVTAAQWLVGRVPGIYSMQDVLSLPSTSSLT